jgi:hypothetical protein
MTSELCNGPARAQARAFTLRVYASAVCRLYSHEVSLGDAIPPPLHAAARICTSTTRSAISATLPGTKPALVLVLFTVSRIIE